MVRQVYDREIACSKSLEVGLLSRSLVVKEMLRELVEATDNNQEEKLGRRETSSFSLSWLGASVLSSLLVGEAVGRKAGQTDHHRPSCRKATCF